MKYVDGESPSPAATKAEIHPTVKRKIIQVITKLELGGRRKSF
jgi:hypothetical protein